MHAQGSHKLGQHVAQVDVGAAGRLLHGSEVRLPHHGAEQGADCAGGERGYRRLGAAGRRRVGAHRRAPPNALTSGADGDACMQSCLMVGQASPGAVAQGAGRAAAPAAACRRRLVPPGRFDRQVQAARPHAATAYGRPTEQSARVPDGRGKRSTAPAIQSAVHRGGHAQ